MSATDNGRQVQPRITFESADKAASSSSRSSSTTARGSVNASSSGQPTSSSSSVSSLRHYRSNTFPLHGSIVTLPSSESGRVTQVQTLKYDSSHRPTLFQVTVRLDRKKGITNTLDFFLSLEPSTDLSAALIDVSMAEAARTSQILYPPAALNTPNNSTASLAAKSQNYDEAGIDELEDLLFTMDEFLTENGAESSPDMPLSTDLPSTPHNPVLSAPLDPVSVPPSTESIRISSDIAEIEGYFATRAVKKKKRFRYDESSRVAYPKS